METPSRPYRLTLLAGRDAGFAGFLAGCLAASELRVKHVQSFSEAMVALHERVPDLVVFVDDLTDAPCAEASRGVREISRVPLLILCGDKASDHVAEVLLSGADDHIPKTVGSPEIEARVTALLRRNQLSSYDELEVIALKSISLDSRRAACSANGQEVRLTPNEFKLLRALALQPGKILSHNQLIEQIWGSPYHASAESLRKLVQRLRHSLAQIIDSREMIVSVSGFGYYLDTNRSEDGEEEA